MFVACGSCMKKDSWAWGEALVLEGREDSFETLAIGPAKGCTDCSFELFCYGTTSFEVVGGRVWSGSGMLQFVHVMLDVPLDPMPEWSRKKFCATLLSLVGCRSVSSLERACGWCVCYSCFVL